MPPSRRDLPIWRFFEKTADGNKTAMCNICHKTFSYKTTVTNLKTHLKQKHMSAFQIYLNLNKQLDSSFIKKGSMSPITMEYEENTSGMNSNMTCGEIEIVSPEHYIIVNESPRKGPKCKQLQLPKKQKSIINKSIDLSLLKMIVYDFQPFSIINDEGFRAYTLALNPTYEIPDLKTLSEDLLPKIYEKRLKETKTFVENNAKSVCVTVDCWTSQNMKSYMGVTAHFITEDPLELKSVLIQCDEFEDHHSSDKIYIEIKNILDSWDLYNKVNFIVSDNASNMESAAKYFETDGWSHFSCFAQKLNLVVQDALAEIKLMLNKVNRIVNHFKKNTTAEEELLQYQAHRQNVLQPKTVVTSIPTRWDTVYLMLERFVELGEALRSTIPCLGTDLPIMPMEEWRCIEQTCVILKPFYETAVEMSAENYLGASKALILTSSLINICQNYINLPDLYLSVKRFATKLNDGMMNRLGDLEENTILSLSTVLDPRFKLKSLKNKAFISEIKNILKQQILYEMNNALQPSLKKEKQASSTSAQKSNSSKFLDTDIPSYSLWCQFDSENDEEFDLKTSDNEAAHEMEKYLANNLIKRTECPLKYWEEHKYIYPNLFKLFIKYGNIMATSIPCDYVFSKSEYSISDRRTRLSTEKIAQIMFLNYNKM